MELSESKLKILVGCILLLFLVQEVLTQKYISEPYPALKMPSFSGNRMNSDGFYEISSVEIKISFQQEEERILVPRQFFHNAPMSHQWTFLNKFKPVKKTETENRYQQLSFLKQIFPGFFVSRNRSQYQIQRHPETLEWLKKQISTISPESTPEEISFIWYNDQFDPTNVLQAKRSLEGTTTIVL